MTENLDEPGQCAAEAGDNSDRWLAAIRERAIANTHPSPRPWPRAVTNTALALAVLTHLLLGWWLASLMRQRPMADENRIEVRLLDAPPPEPALPPRSPESVQPTVALATPSLRPQTRTPEKPSMPLAKEMPVMPSIRIYNPDGSIALPPEDAPAVSPSAFVASSTAASALMGPHRPLKLRPNHFADAWRAPQKETLLGATLRKVGDFVDDNLTVKKEFTTPWGSKIVCEAGYMFILAKAGCAWGFPPPPGGRPTEHWKPATELDEK